MQFYFKTPFCYLNFYTFHKFWDPNTTFFIIIICANNYWCVHQVEAKIPVPLVNEADLGSTVLYLTSTLNKSDL